MRTRIGSAAGAALCAIALAGSALAHGGSYIGIGPGAASGETGIPAPGGGMGGGPMGPGPSTGGPIGGKGPATGDGGMALASWEDWWHFNRDPYLQLKSAIAARSPATRGDDLEAALRGTAGAEGLVPASIVRERIGPALAKLLTGERSGEIQAASLVALARLGDLAAQVDAAGTPARNASLAAGAPGEPRAPAGSLQAISAFLADANQEIAETAALALGILRDEEAIPVLASLLASDERGQKLVGGREVPVRTRAFAAYGLGLVAERARNNRTRQVVARALTDAFDGRSRAGRGAPVRQASPDVQVAIVVALSLDALRSEEVESASAPWISRQTLVHWLEGLFADGRRHALVRAHAATAIARLAQDAPEELRAEAVEILLGAVRARRSLENEVLQSCAIALGLLGDSDADKQDREVRNALGLLLDDPDPIARSFALIALAEIGARPGPGDRNEEGLNGCRNAIQGELARGRRSVRPWAALALGVLERRILDLRERPRDGGPPPPKPSPAVREMLRSELVGARARDTIGSAAIALGLCRDETAAPLLLRRLKETGEETGQGHVALALGMIGADEAAGPLRKLARESKLKMGLLEPAAMALALLGDAAGADDLVGLFPQTAGQAAQVSLTNAIGFVGDARAVDPLLRAIERGDLSSSARAFAATALGRVADREPLPWSSAFSRDLNYTARPATLIAGDGTGLLEIL